jgi:hypothetical protein
MRGWKQGRCEAAERKAREEVAMFNQDNLWAHSDTQRGHGYLATSL